MHILQINTEKGWRGGERQTLLCMEGLRDAGVPATLLCLRDRPLWQRAREAGFPVVGVAGHAGLSAHLLFRGRRYSVWHAQSSRAFGFAAIASLTTHTPLVYTRRVDFVPRGKLTQCKYRRAAALVAISSAIRDTLKTAGMGEATVISSIVPDRAPDPAKSASLRRELHLDGRRVVGVVAMLSSEKDPFTMLRAATHVIERLPDTVFLHFGGGPLQKKVADEHARLNLRNSYRLLGYRSDVEAYFPLFDCFAMSSTKEGLGSSVLDAYKNGVPVASTDAGGLAELVDGRGLLSAKGDPAALGGSIVRLLTDRPLAAALSETARAYVLAYHDRKVLTDRYIELYNKVSGRTAP
ncbi:MAG: glycosyltransferase family 4 protein [Chitinispirillaceae bacterium]|nr:glycosyltransferase family 4 protein [Chitinispirillaceae bacterium]